MMGQCHWRAYIAQVEENLKMGSGPQYPHLKHYTRKIYLQGFDAENK